MIEALTILLLTLVILLVVSGCLAGWIWMMGWGHERDEEADAIDAIRRMLKP